MGNAHPWRQLSETGKRLETKLEKDILNLKLPKSTPILLVGPSGAGKSSFINSVLSVGAKRLCTVAKTGIARNETESLTFKLKAYKEDRLLKHLEIMDCMGLVANPKKGLKFEDFHSILDGHIQPGFKFSEEPISKNDNSYRENPSIENKVHCVVLVIDINALSKGFPKTDMDEINKLLKAAEEADIPVVLILTKTDMFDDFVKTNTENIFRCASVYQMVKLASELFNIEQCDVHPVVNYREETEISTGMNVVILSAMRRIMEHAYDHMTNELGNRN